MKFLYLIFLLGALSWPLRTTAQSTALGPLIATEEIQLAVQNIARQLEENYLFADKAKVASTLLRAKLRAGDFNGQYDFLLLNLQISSMLAQLTNDSGFELIQQSAITLTDGQQQLANTPTNQHDEFVTGILDHNIGYVKITGNFDYPDGHDLIAQQFRLLSTVDALIIDLRQADEAAISVAQQVISYFVQSGTTIANLQLKQHVETITTGNTADVKTFKQDLPLYIVNSAFVAGSWEFFSYTLQHFDKAVIVGERTMGVGYLSQVFRVSDSLAIRMNHALLTHPISGEHWDNEGVVPDYFYDRNDAFNKAYQLALAQLSSK
jgi:hypothetical protein